MIYNGIQIAKCNGKKYIYFSVVIFILELLSFYNYNLIGGHIGQKKCQWLKVNKQIYCT